MSTFDDHWATLRRSTPDPNAPSTPAHSAVQRYINITRLILTLLFQLPLLTLRHYIFGPLLPWMPLSTYLLTRFIKLSATHLNAHLPDVEHEEWIIPKAPWKTMQQRRIGEIAEMARIPPVRDEMRQGIAVCEAVKSVERPGFMCSPDGAMGKGTEKAREGEKVMYYIVGG